MYNIDQIKEKLSSDKIEVKIKAIDDIHGLISDMIQLVIDSFVNVKDRLFIAERVYNLSNIVDDKLDILFTQTDDEDLKFYIAIIRLMSNEKSYSEYLLFYVMSDNASKALFSANKLADANVTQVVPLIIDKITKLDTIHYDYIVSYITVLKKMDVPIPEELRQKLSSPDTPWQIKAVL